MRKYILAIILLLFIIGTSVPAFAVGVDDNTNVQIPAVQSETAVLLDADTGQVLYEKDMDKQMYPASITKVMTGMLALREGDLSDIITMSSDAVSVVEPDSANIALSTGEQLTLEQAVYAIAIASANEAANGIAEAIGGTLDGFVAMMNAAATEAGATNTHFNNANGLPDDNHYTTAHDMALITAQALKTPGFVEIFGERRYQISPTNLQPETRIINSSNRFINGAINYDGMLFSKAGWTNAAQHTLVSAAERDGVTLIVVVMKNADSTVKWSDTTALFDYGFDQFKQVTVTEEAILSAVPEDLTIPNLDDLEIDTNTLTAADTSLLLREDEQPEDIHISYGVPQIDESSNTVEIPVKLTIPDDEALSGGREELAATTVTATLQPVASESDLAGSDSATKGTFKSILKTIFFILLAIVGLLLLVFVFLVIRRAIIVRRRRERRRREALRKQRR